MFRLPVDEIVHDYHLAYPDAETLTPALLTVLMFARNLGTQNIRVSNVNLRDGLLQEMANKGVWSEDFTEQVINSALDIGRHYAVDEKHARHIAHLSGTLFHALKSQHRLDDRYSVMLKLAALLHEIGLFVGIAGYHKHTMYLIQNSELFGLSQRDLRLVAQVARYHRRASPKPSHSGYANLNREDRVIVSKLASILRIADALDCSCSQRIHNLECQVNRNRLILSVPGLDDLSLEQIALKQSGGLFEETYGISVLLRQTRS
jgi:exopolyphosphatase/guanosine-5'-triphosphate,3'-diphosphate pyrophosphatase